jgi:hypothetical protein
MTTTLLSLALIALLPGEPAGRGETTRKPSPLAPSLPELTDAEEDQLDEVIDRFILFDTGKLTGEAGKRAKAEFDRLGPEATFALIRGVNRAAKIESSCPAVIIAKKLSTILTSSNDPLLLDFARENIGIGVERSRHLNVLRDLRVACIMRKRIIGPQTALTTGSSPGTTPYRSMSIGQLTEAAGTEPPPRKKQILTELSQRRGDEALVALASVAASTSDKEVKRTAREMLDRGLSRLTVAGVKDKLKDDRAELRASAARVSGTKGYRLNDELIGLLADLEPEVRQAARQALVRLSRGQDFGPDTDADDAGRDKAVRQWRAWWDRQKGR